MITYTRIGKLNLKKFGEYTIFQIYGGEYTLKYFFVELNKNEEFDDFASFTVDYKVITNSELYKSIEFDINAGLMNMYNGKQQTINGILNKVWQNIRINGSWNESIYQEFFNEISKHIDV